MEERDEQHGTNPAALSSLQGSKTIKLQNKTKKQPSHSCGLSLGRQAIAWVPSLEFPTWHCWQMHSLFSFFWVMHMWTSLICASHQCTVESHTSTPYSSTSLCEHTSSWMAELPNKGKMQYALIVKSWKNSLNCFTPDTPKYCSHQCDCSLWIY